MPPARKVSAGLLAARALTRPQPVPRMNSVAMQERVPLCLLERPRSAPMLTFLNGQGGSKSDLLPGKII